jgi:predicted dehydrogenase
MLVNPKEDCVACPEHIAVIGGGRWARVLLEVLCSLVPPTVRLSAHSPHNAGAMQAWVLARGLEHRIRVLSEYPKVIAGKSGAVIVANAARDHEKAIEWALSERLPVLVEKPVTLSSAATQRMADLAMSKETYLASAHVFLFARYVDVFSKLVSEGGGVQSIRVQWMDPQAESRYGEVKSYDPGLTVYADWLPHIISILGSLSPDSMQVLQKLEVLRGGAYLKLDIQLGDTPCEIELVRNGNGRQRLIEVTTRHGPITLDFAKEPGTIVSGTTARYGDPAWESEPRPVSGMLRAFLLGAAGGGRDERLDIGIGLRANQLIDQLTPAYHAALSSWLSKKYPVPGDGVDADLRYAFSEILYTDDPYSSVPTEQRIEYLYRHIMQSVTSILSEGYKNRPMELIGLIIKQGKLVSYL